MSAQARRRLARLIHLGRLALVVVIVWQLTARASEWSLSATPKAVADLERQDVEGVTWLTSPEGDEVLGWAGPTTLLLIPDDEGRVTAARIVRSADSASYVWRIRDDPVFLESLVGFKRHELGDWQADAVSGATLTSRAIVGAVRRKFGGEMPPAPFSPMAIEASDPDGWILQSVAVPDVGYQGPTQVVLDFGADDRLRRLVLGETFDSEPYFSDVRDDYSFLKSFTGLTLQELAALEIGRGGVEGVSGATMTSQGIARIVRATAESELTQRNDRANEAVLMPLVRSPRELLGWMVGGAALLVLVTPLRRRRAARMGLRLGVVLGFGVGAGALLSLDAVWSWSQHGLPWQSAPLLAGFVLAAVVGPALFGRKTYCRSLCAHGALQQLLAKRAKNKLPARVDALFRFLPGALLVAAVFMLVLATRDAGSQVELAGWEPFAAWMPQSAAMASLILAGLSVLAASWVPLAYCHYACPTGALLEYLRDQPKVFFKRGDLAAAALLIASLAI